MSRGKTNRAKGHTGERIYAKLFRELGFPFCKTSRQASRLLDDSGIDLFGLPFNVQIKTGKHAGINYSNVLNIIKERLPSMFPSTDEVHKQPNILIHRKEVGAGKKRDEFHDLVSMSFEDFKKIIKNSNYVKSK